MTQSELKALLSTPTKKQKDIVKLAQNLQSGQQKIESSWDWFSKQMMKPVGSIAAETENLGLIIKAIRGKKEEGEKALQIPGVRSIGVLSGKEDYSFSKLWEEYGEGAGISKPVSFTIGLATDLTADPFNFIGGGATKLGKLADKVTQLKNASKEIKSGSKLFKEIEKSGYTADQLSLAGSKLEQVRKNQRALVTFAGNPLIKGEKVYETVEKVGGKIKSVPAVEKVSSVLSKTFSTSSGNKKLDDFIEGFKNSTNAEKERIMSNAVKLEKSVSSLKPEELKLVSEVIENPEIRDFIGSKTVKETADTISSFFKEMENREASAGVLRTALKDYFPHIKKPEEIGETVKSFFDPKKYQQKLKYSTGRSLVKLVGESGEEFITNLDTFGGRKTLLKDLEEKATGKFKTRASELSKQADELEEELKVAASDGEKIKYSDRKFLKLDRLDAEVESLLKQAHDEKQLLDFKVPEGEGRLIVKDNDIYRVKNATVKEINEKFGKEFFISDPVLAYAIRGIGSSKAVNAQEFLTKVGKEFFVSADNAPISYVESTNPLFKGLKAPKEVVETVDKYSIGIKPEELKTVVRAFDSIQNWWKSQALISPMYHTRNTVGNLWNNFLGGVYNPISYKKATDIQIGNKLDDVILTTANGDAYTGKQVMEMAIDNGAFGKGQYSGDIEQAIKDEMMTLREALGNASGYNPFSQSNIAIKANQNVGSFIENNARLAHFIKKLEDGYSPLGAARSVKKYLFDYTDLTETEQKIFKRIAPFYTWTRKNIPLQLENLVYQPAKWASVPKVVSAIESGKAQPETEKYMSSYLKENIPVNVGQDENGNYQYFMLGNWLPSAQAIDFLSQPFENITSMITPFAKTPLELWSNKSTFFKNTLGEPSQIEYYRGQPGEFLGMEMPKKTIHLLRNIRILNDLNNFLKTPTRDEPENSDMVKIMNALFGKAATYDVGLSAKSYGLETEGRITDYKKSIKKALREGNKDYAEKIEKEMKEFIAKRK